MGAGSAIFNFWVSKLYFRTHTRLTEELEVSSHTGSAWSYVGKLWNQRSLNLNLSFHI